MDSLQVPFHNIHSDIQNVFSEIVGVATGLLLLKSCSLLYVIDLEYGKKFNGFYVCV